MEHIKHADFAQYLQHYKNGSCPATGRSKCPGEAAKHSVARREPCLSLGVDSCAPSELPAAVLPSWAFLLSILDLHSQLKYQAPSVLMANANKNRFREMLSSRSSSSQRRRIILKLFYHTQGCKEFPHRPAQYTQEASCWPSHIILGFWSRPEI